MDQYKSMGQYKFKEAIVIPLSDGSELALIVYELDGQPFLIPAFADPFQHSLFKQLLKEYGINPTDGEIAWDSAGFIHDVSQKQKIN
ncbi:hypothetical protein [Nitrosomonas sp. Nm34]|uniref:hypothetical protein n=1 Tax=Nitrosomonas sp. Nm34 TaxID=1881055 RepID=UPI0008E1854E|nr:hypothetical protein [Nitrosomonas sp. Nm34]SFI67480.1 hypothetical protein SAMN05428978_102517 [Nitrosomonas sp. Nm34]